MTECERIIKEGILPESFFKEEIRCDYLVTNKRKKIWAIELDLLIKFDEVCKKYDLTYWADGGTLLGAVRHNGFIPWDDDVDVIMPRKDYEKLLSVAKDEFNGRYYLVTPQTENNYYYSFAKLMNLNTTCLYKAFEHAGFVQGVFLDVFILDYVNPLTFEDERETIKKLISGCSAYMKRNDMDKLSPEQLKRFKTNWTEHPNVDCDEIHRIASNPNYVGSEYVANVTNTSLKLSAALWKTSWFEKTIMHQFETIVIPMPISIDARLKAQYGDYMTFPPLEERDKWHDGLVFDPDIPCFKKNEV